MYRCAELTLHTILFASMHILRLLLEVSIEGVEARELEYGVVLFLFDLGAPVPGRCEASVDT